MAKKIKSTDAKASISLEEYIEYCDTNLDPEDQENVLAGAGMLQALTENKTFLVDRINQYFKHAGELEELNTYSAQALILAVRPKYFLRTNTWVKPTVYAADDSWERTLYSYGFPHNHNFNLLTAGYFGPGYFTDLYQLNSPKSMVGYLGEKVDMSYNGLLQLELGDVLLYERVTDVHVQHAPAALSISINLMPLDSRVSLTEQFGFDVANSTISSLVGSQVAQQVDLMRIAACVGNENTAEVVLGIARRHPNQSTRLGALNSACTLLPAEAERIWSIGLQDKSEVVRSAAKSTLLSESPMMV